MAKPAGIREPSTIRSTRGRGIRVLAVTLLAAVVVPLLIGCVELTGQRFTWFHDLAKDTFYLLIQYDGIHEAKREPRGREQIPKFIADGDIMILDWVGHLRRSTATSHRGSKDPLLRGVAALYDRVKTEVLGRYREPDPWGDRRCGAAQLVTIERFQDFLKEANRLIDLWFVTQDRADVVGRAKKSGGLWRTLDRMFAAAARHHTWITAHGHALRLTVPYHREEFTDAKGTAILAMAREFAKAARGPEQQDVELLLRSLAGSAFSYTESDATVTLTLGDEARPRTLHIQIRNSYNTELESVVAEHVPLDLDELLRRPAADAGTEAGTGSNTGTSTAAWRAVRPWLPPEVEVGALLSTYGREDPTEETLARLHRIGTRFNESGGHPEAPDPTGRTRGAYLSDWIRWYRRRRRTDL